MESMSERQRAVAFALTLAENTQIAPDADEQRLLDEFVQGRLTLEQLEEQLKQHWKR